jgi:NAD(P)-dependent dehydrogenase (short-subunit alcohol dehydrogenase family)
MKFGVITGASGIGWATARLLLDRGFRVFGGVRRLEGGLPDHAGPITRIFPKHLIDGIIARRLGLAPSK